jgi:stalled ribosome alternative rescue factor ArfA
MLRNVVEFVEPQPLITADNAAKNNIETLRIKSTPEGNWAQIADTLSRHEFGHKPKGRESYHTYHYHTNRETYQRPNETDGFTIRLMLLAAEYGKHHKAA